MQNFVFFFARTSQCYFLIPHHNRQRMWNSGSQHNLWLCVCVCGKICFFIVNCVMSCKHCRRMNKFCCRWWSEDFLSFIFHKSTYAITPNIACCCQFIRYMRERERKSINNNVEECGIFEGVGWKFSLESDMRRHVEDC
jgi:hypothetical protein